MKQSKIIRFFDKLEDKIRYFLSRYPIPYALIAAVAIVLFWRGVEMTADLFPFMTGPVSLIISIVLALITGVFVSFFIGEQVIISGIKREKKIIEKTEEEIRMETDLLNDVKNRLGKIEKDISYIKNKIK